MAYVRWTFFIVFWGLVASIFHYTLPQHDIARITETEVRRIDPGDNRWFWASADVGSDGTFPNRDVFFISTVLENGQVMVYRNEDTGWGWPPYFKFNSANLDAEAGDLRSTADDPQWVVITHYGWRAEVLTIFPNAISIRAVESPDVQIIPWVSIVILVLCGLLFWAIWVRWRRFRQRRIDPVLDDIGDGFADASDAVGERTGALRRWFSRSR
ncbi:MAG: DUF1523 family protein [Marinovum sp.]|nr:DUF1523 family protein [Marinovum sp.]